MTEETASEAGPGVAVPRSRPPLLQNIASGAVLTALSFGIGFLVLPYILRHLGNSDFGLWALVSSVVGYMGLLDLGLPQTFAKQFSQALGARDKASLQREVRVAVTLYLALALGVVVLLIPASGALPSLFKVDARQAGLMTQLVLGLGVQIVLAFPTAIVRALVAALQETWVINVFTFLSVAARSLGTVAVLAAGHGLIAMMWVTIAVALVELLAIGRYVATRLPDLSYRPCRISKKEVGPLFRNASVIFTGHVAGRVMNESDRLVLGVFRPTAELAIYEIALRLCNYSRLVLYSASAILPTAALKTAEEDVEAMRRIYAVGTRWLFYCFAGVASGLFVLGKAFIRLWVGPGYDASATILVILLLGSLIQAGNVTAYYLILGSGRLRLFGTVMAIYPLLNLLLSFPLAKYFAGPGVAAATAITYLALEPVILVHGARRFGIRVSSVLKWIAWPSGVAAAVALLSAGLFGDYLAMMTWPGLIMSALAFAFVWMLIGVSTVATGEERREAYAWLRRGFAVVT